MRAKRKQEDVASFKMLSRQIERMAKYFRQAQWLLSMNARVNFHLFAPAKSPLA